MKKLFFIVILTVLFANLSFSQSAGCAQDSIYMLKNGVKVKYTDEERLSGIQLSCDRQMDTLVPSVFAWGDPSSGYVVEPLDFDYTLNYVLSNEVILPKDDCWGKVFSLSFNNPTPAGVPPFSFNFFGEEYVNVVPNSNGSLRFVTGASDYTGTNAFVTPDNATTATEYLFCSYATSQTLPDARQSWGYNGNGSPVLNAVMTPFHDIHFSSEESSNGCSQYPGHMYFEIQGEYPCRKILLSYYQVPLFSGSSHCHPDSLATHMAVLYETTNVIEFYIKDSYAVSSTNNNKSILGIQNLAGTQAYCPEGRNDGVWRTRNEAWRIRPTGELEYDIAWFKRPTQGPQAGELVAITSEVDGTDRGILANPTMEEGNTWYICRAEIYRLDGNSFFVYDSIMYMPFQTDTMRLTGRFNSVATQEITSNVSLYDTICKGENISFTLQGAKRYAIVSPSAYANTEIIIDSAMVNDSLVFTGSVTLAPHVDSVTDMTFVFNYIDFGTSYSDTTCKRSLTTRIHLQEFEVELGADTTVCRNEEVTYKDLLREVEGVYTFSNGYEGEETTYTPQQTEYLYCTLTDKFGCIATDSVLVNVNDAPDISIEGTLAICQGESTTLNVVSSLPNCLFEWSSGQTTQSITVSPNTTTEYQVTVKLPPAMCSTATSVTVEVKQAPEIWISEDVNICNGETATIEVMTNESETPRYVWTSLDESVNNFTESSFTVSPNTSTQYIVTAYNDINCHSSDTMTVFVEQKPIPIITFNPRTIDALTPIVIFTDSTENSVSTLWEISDGAFSEDRVFMHEFDVGDTNLTYIVSLTSQTAFGCTDSVSTLIRVKREHYLWAPTGVYIHASDPQNSTFALHIDNITEFNLKIYNRWGTLMFETNDINQVWDCTYKGKTVQQGVYVWKATYRHNDAPNRLQTDSGEFMIYE
ncbi:MAG: gliding motility-associated C-terminal domain-containing protein [Bacteroidota bacterium]|nr:gliding motility-associated C-terminal domain-containing protein [Bacteroidota bacterium]